MRVGATCPDQATKQAADDQRAQMGYDSAGRGVSEGAHEQTEQDEDPDRTDDDHHGGGTGHARCVRRVFPLLIGRRTDFLQVLGPPGNLAPRATAASRGRRCQRAGGTRVLPTGSGFGRVFAGLSVESEETVDDECCAETRGEPDAQHYPVLQHPGLSSIDDGGSTIPSDDDGANRHRDEQRGDCDVESDQREVLERTEIDFADRCHGEQREDEPFGSAEPEESRHRQSGTRPDMAQPRQDRNSPTRFRW